MTKKEVYAQYGVEFKDGKILSPLGWVSPLMPNGNEKLGDGVFTWSTLPGNIEHRVTICGKPVEVKGTCPCNCKGCYAQSGNFHRANVKKSLALKTILSREYLDFVERAIIAQINSDNIEMCRIHASGDFTTDEYIEMWRNIIEKCPSTDFWSYTKNERAEHAFDDLKNVNIVPSIIPGFGFNFGHCDYILRVYRALRAMGKRVHVCRCGFDKNQHCNNCKGCIENEFVLFVEHSTAYCAEKDPAYSELYNVAMHN